MRSLILIHDNLNVSHDLRIRTASEIFDFPGLQDVTRMNQRTLLGSLKAHITYLRTTVDITSLLRSKDRERYQ